VEAQKADPASRWRWAGDDFQSRGGSARARSRQSGARETAATPTPAAKAATEGEDWLGAVEKLFGPGEKLARDLAYAESMRRMHDKYPADDEVTSFYALAILGTSHGGRDFSIYMRAAALVEQVYAKNPQHPGAAHYLIHAYDDPVHAPLGLRYADAYAKIAPSASHALHMPSHIYVAMGMWDESARSTAIGQGRRCCDAGEEARADQRGFHALPGSSAAPQQGRYEDARASSTQMKRRRRKRLERNSHAPPRAAWLIETRSGVKRRRRWWRRPAEDAAIAELFAIGFAAV
jgi:hypothetical protein